MDDHSPGHYLAYLGLYFVTLIGSIGTDGAGGYYYPAVVLGVAAGAVVMWLY